MDLDSLVDEFQNRVKMVRMYHRVMVQRTMPSYPGVRKNKEERAVARHTVH